jgi:hypothetical protein
MFSSKAKCSEVHFCRGILVLLISVFKGPKKAWVRVISKYLIAGSLRLSPATAMIKVKPPLGPITTERGEGSVSLY